MAIQSPSIDMPAAASVRATPVAVSRGYWVTVGRRLRRDPVTLACLGILVLIECNDLAINNNVVIPVVARPLATAVKSKLVVELTGWDNNTWDLPNWYREA